MTRSIQIFLAAFAILLVGCDNSTSTTSAEKSQATNAANTSNKIDPKNYDGPLFPAIKDGKYGFIDTKGNFLIPPTFTSAENFSEGMAAVYVGGRSFIYGESGQHISLEGGKWGYIDRTGEIKIPPQFGEAAQFNEGLAFVAGDIGHKEAWGFIDAQGLYKINPKYGPEQSSFKNGIAFVRLADSDKVTLENGHWFDVSGKEISIAEAAEKMAKHSALNKKHWIDASGKVIDGIKALSIIKLNRIAFEQKNTLEIDGGAYYNVGQEGLKDSKGRVVVKAKFYSIGDFYNKFEGKVYEFTDACIVSTWITYPRRNYAMMKTVKCGLIDMNGDFVLAPDFDRVRLISEDLAVFTIGCDRQWECDAAKEGIFSIKEQKIIVNPQFKWIGKLRDGLIAVDLDGKLGFIDVSGKYVIQPQFTSALLFKDGLARVGLADYINKTGEYVYKGSIGNLQPKPKETTASPGAGNPVSASGSLAKKGTGTVFIISKEGHAITNHHVVGGCSELRVEGREGVAKLVTADEVNDLALIKVPGNISATATIAADPVKLRQGDDIIVFGFPLNAVLSSGGNLTPGVVSALTGLGNNTNQIQITAPIQPGSSGSPVLNKKGEVVGVVSMKLDDIKMAKATGQFGQNVNFAVSGQTLKSFVDTHKVRYRSGGMLSFEKSTADLADEARKWTLVVECWK